MESSNKNIHYVNPKFEKHICNKLTDPSTWNLKENAELFCYVDSDTSNSFYVHLPFCDFKPDNLVVDMCSCFLHYDVDFGEVDYAFHAVKKSIGIGGSMAINIRSDKYEGYPKRDDIPHSLNW